MLNQSVSVFRSPGAYEAAQEAERAASLQRHAQEAISRRQRKHSPVTLRGASTEAERVAFSRQLIQDVPASTTLDPMRYRHLSGYSPRLMVLQGGSPGLGRRH